MAKKQIYQGSFIETLVPKLNAQFLDGKSSDYFTTPEQVNQILANKLNSSPDQLKVIDEIREKLSSETDLADILTEEIAKAKKALFVDMWKDISNHITSYRYTYNEDTDLFGFELISGNNEISPVNPLFKEYEIHDITYSDALTIYACKTNAESPIDGFLTEVPRTNIPPFGYQLGSGININFPKNQILNKLEVLVLTHGVLQNIRYKNVDLKVSNLSFHKQASQPYLKAIIGHVQLVTPFSGNCPALELILPFINTNLPQHFELCPNLRLESFQAMVKYKRIEEPIIIYVHLQCYVKLTDPENTEWYQVNQDAIANQITFATVD